MTRTSVIIPVKDAGPLLGEVLGAVVRERPDEIVVIDSGSTDGSIEIAREFGAKIIAISPSDFGHGRTRNLAARESSGEIILFLTQDATPVEGWLDSYLEVFEADPSVGAAFGPHLARATTSPMIARELAEFFAGFSPDGEVAIRRPDDGAGAESFLSNANAAYRRDPLLDIGFRDLAYSEDQAFGKDLLAAGWSKAFVPQAAVLHAHEFAPTEFIKRYFDEYRGLNASVGHVEPLKPVDSIRQIRRQVAGDISWARRNPNGADDSELAIAGWSVVHHAGRKLAAVAGTRAARLPETVQRRLSLEGTATDAKTTVGGDRPHGPTVVGKRIPPKRDRELYYEVLDLDHGGTVELLPPVTGMSEQETLHIAIVIPPFLRGSGGHDTIFRIFRHIEEMGHTCSFWLADPTLKMKGEWPAVIRQRIREEFVELEAPVFKGFGDWYGADVVLATGWQTVTPILQLPNCRARAYFVQDYEPSFSPTSAESLWAEGSYGHDFFAICASPWLADIMSKRFGAKTSVFQLGVDEEMYFPRDVERRRDTVAFYGRASTSRRAVPLGMLALAELCRRRPDTRVVIYGNRTPLESTFPYEYLGVASQEQLATLYSEATVGLCLSVTNYSRAPQEMMACGLPCVDLAGFSAESVFGADGPVTLSDFSPVALADHMEDLITDEARWETLSREGIDFASEHTWKAAATEVEEGLRAALRERENLLPQA